MRPLRVVNTDKLSRYHGIATVSANERLTMTSPTCKQSIAVAWKGDKCEYCGENAAGRVYHGRTWGRVCPSKTACNDHLQDAVDYVSTNCNYKED